MLSPSQRVMIAAMRRGQTVSTREMIDTLYGARRDGGPEDAARTVRVEIYKMRRKLKPVGIEIETVGVTRSCAGWRLKPEHIEMLDAVLET